MSPSNNETISLNKFISDTGICSRRAADVWIKEGRVTINDVIATSGNRVGEGDTVKIDGKLLQRKEAIIYLAFNKPVGITCTTELHIKGNIINYINYPKRIFPIGRLDKESEGLIFLTNDGDIVNKILRAGNNHEKEYIVTVDKPITPAFLHKMSNGIPVLDTITQPCIVTKESKFVFKIILTQGLNRQIRRMCAYLDYKVVRLRRVRIMNITLQDLPIGKWRDITRNEMDVINSLIADSSKTEEASQLPKVEKDRL